MRRKTKTYKKIAKVFDELGIRLVKEDTLYSFEKEHVDYLMDISEDEETFTLINIIVGLKGELTKVQFDTSLDVVKHFHEDYDGDWNDGSSYFTSPSYCLHGFKSVPKYQMEKIIEDFFEAYSFMCMNVCMVTDDTIWKDL